MNIVRCRRCPSAIVRVRGCCTNCYQHYHSRVRAGEATWEELERLGKVNPAKPKKRPWEKRP